MNTMDNKDLSFLSEMLNLHHLYCSSLCWTLSHCIVLLSASGYQDCYLGVTSHHTESQISCQAPPTRGKIGVGKSWCR